MLKRRLKNNWLSMDREKEKRKVMTDCFLQNSRWRSMHHADLWFREHAMQRRMLSEWKMFQQKERLGERFLLPSGVSRLAVCSTGNVLIFHSGKRIAKLFFLFLFLSTLRTAFGV